MIDPKLTKMGELFRIGAGSPAIDVATSMFPANGPRGSPRGQ
jgi:hypothetical protein